MLMTTMRMKTKMFMLKCQVFIIKTQMGEGEENIPY